MAFVGSGFGECERGPQNTRDGKSGDGEDLFFAHDAHGLVAELKGVVDGFDAGASGVKRSGFAGGVDRHAISGARGLVDGGSEFVLGVLIGSREAAIHERVVPVS